MVFNTGAALLDGIVLAVVAKDTDGTYGYKITHEVKDILDISESTLYPVLRRLQKDQYLSVYDMQYDGRNRRYYKITDSGHVLLNQTIDEWNTYSSKLNTIFKGEEVQ